MAAVALLAEGVDRNPLPETGSISIEVALLAEGVDRNSYTVTDADGDTLVALLAEGVDRNTYLVLENEPEWMSPSSRRAWIEIPAGN